MISALATALGLVVAWILISRRRRAIVRALATLAPVAPLILVRLILSLLVAGVDLLERRLPGADRRLAAAYVLRGIREAPRRVVLDIEGHA